MSVMRKRVWVAIAIGYDMLLDTRKRESSGVSQTLALCTHVSHMQRYDLSEVLPGSGTIIINN
jgi:hypothetical protein